MSLPALLEQQLIARLDAEYRKAQIHSSDLARHGPR